MTAFPDPISFEASVAAPTSVNGTLRVHVQSLQMSLGVQSPSQIEDETRSGVPATLTAEVVQPDTIYVPAPIEPEEEEPPDDEEEDDSMWGSCESGEALSWSDDNGV